MAVEDGSDNDSGNSARGSLSTEPTTAASETAAVAGDPQPHETPAPDTRPLDTRPLDTPPLGTPPTRPSTDWERYGRRPALPPVPPASTLQPDRQSGRRGRAESREDLYADYRRESNSRGTWLKTHPSRRRANLAGIALVLAVAATFLVAGIVATESATSTRSPSPSASPTGSPSPSAATTIPVVTPAPPLVGPLAMVADLPSPVDTPDRSTPHEDGGSLYLSGPQAGLQVNTQTGEIKSRTGPYGNSVGREVVAGGSLWRGSSWEPSAVCGPGCWAKSTTYQLDATSGKVQKTYAATYLVGYDSNALWIASSKGVQKLDPGTGSVLATLAWKTGAEPRVGCGGVWSVASGGQGDFVLRKVNTTTGVPVGQDSNLTTFFYGPVQVHGHCWTMGNGVAGAALPPTGFALVQATDGTASQMFNPSAPVVVLDGEFWTYESGGVLQRYDPTIGPYGSKVQLGVVPILDSPLALFSSMHKLWAIDGQRLIGYDVTTGPTGTGSRN